MEEFIFHIIKLNLFAGAAVAAGCILDRFLRRRYSVRRRYILWLCIAALLLVPVDLSKSYAVWEVQIPVQQTQAGNGGTVLAKDGTYMGEPQTDIQEAAVGTGGTDALDEKNRFTENKGQGFRGIPSEWIYGGFFIVWIGGALLLAAWRSVSYLAALKRLRRWSIPEVSEEAAALYKEACRRYGKRRAPKLMVNEELSGPLLAGTVRTCLHLPDAVYTKRELRMIFAHELCHYYRRDLWYKMLLYAAATVYWFNPAMVFLLREADRDLELLCDAQVTAGKSREYCLAYNRLLLKSAASSHGNLYYLSSSMNDGMADFKRRVTNIMGAKKLKRGLIPALLLSVTLVGANALVGCTADGEAKKENTADTEAVLEPENIETESEAKNTKGNTETDNTQKNDVENQEIPDESGADVGEEKIQNSSDSKEESTEKIEFPKIRESVYYLGTDPGPWITIETVNETTVTFTITDGRGPSNELEHEEATIIDKDTIVYKQKGYDLTMHWQPAFEREDMIMDVNSTGGIYLTGSAPESSILGFEMLYHSRYDSDVAQAE